MSNPVVLGVDTNSRGFHVVASEPINMPLAGGEIHSTRVAWHQSTDKDAAVRRLSMFRAMHQLSRVLPSATAVFVEEPIVMTTNVQTTKLMCMAAAAVELGFFEAQPDASIFWVNLSTWRKEVLGKGTGPKAVMKQLAMSRAQHDLGRQWEALAPVFEEQPDLADAYGVMVYGAGQLSAGAVRLR